MPAQLYRFAWKRNAAFVRTHDAALVAELGRFLDLEPGLEENPPPGSGETLVTIAEEDGVFHVATIYWQVRAGSREQLLFAALEAVGQIFVHNFSGAIFHAGAFLGESGAVMFFGAPQSGKSSLGFAAWKRNLPLIGDDRVVLLDEGRRIRPFPKCVKLRLAEDGALPAGAEAVAPEMMVKADLGHEIRLILARALPGFSAYDSEANVNLLVELKRGASGETSLTPLAPGDALDSVLENVVSPDFDPMGVVRLIKRQAEGGKLFRLTVDEDSTERALDLLLAR
jgi:hypothetical protein